MPKNSFIDATKFTNLEDLGNFLKKVGSDEALWNSYMEWKKNPNDDFYTKVKPFSAMEFPCNLCYLLKNKTYRQKQ
jgi:hypothetical protein